MKKDDYVKIVATNGDYQYGYIAKVQDYGTTFIVDLLEEGKNKIAFDAEMAKHLGYLPELPEDYISKLSDIEKHVARLLASSADTRKIADEMGISPTTVRAHMRNLRIKLHLDNRIQLISFCQGLKL